MANPMKVVTWSLATFHATTFVLAIVLLAYLRGGLGAALGGLNTLVGLGLFVALWATTYFTTAKALAGLDLIESRHDRNGYLRRTVRWGARNGMAFLAVLGFVALVAAVANTRPEQLATGILIPGLFVASIGLVVSAAVGGAVGLVLGVIDLALFALADLGRRDPEPTI